MYQPKSAQLVPLQTLHASKHHASPAHCLSTWHEGEWEAKPWHPRAGGEEPWGKLFRQALERLKLVVQTDYYLVALVLSSQVGG